MENLERTAGGRSLHRLVRCLFRNAVFDDVSCLVMPSLQNDLPVLVEFFRDAWRAIVAVEYSSSDALTIVEVIRVRRPTFWRVILNCDDTPISIVDPRQCLDRAIFPKFLNDRLISGSWDTLRILR